MEEDNGYDPLSERYECSILPTELILQNLLVARVGIEPTYPEVMDFKSIASA
jgi:hypothetical protein